MSSPLVSIIIPTFNRAHVIGETLDSVLAQTYTNWECIVVDDGSTDATEVLLTSYSVNDSRFKYYKRPLNELKGASSCRNIGLFKAKGEYAVFLDSDDLLISKCLENRLNKLKDYPNNAFFVFPMMIKEKGKQRIDIQMPKDKCFLIEFLSYRIPWSIMSVLWNMEFLKQIEGFDVSYSRLNDPEIHIRAILEAKGNYKVFCNDAPDTIYRVDVEGKNNSVFALKYYESLCLLVVNTSKKLIQTNNKKHIPLLKGYLKDYMTIFFKFNTRRNNISLFKCFYKNKVITFYQFIYLSTLYYSFYIFNFCTEKTKKKMNNFFES